MEKELLLKSNQTLPKFGMCLSFKHPVMGRMGRDRHITMIRLICSSIGNTNGSIVLGFSLQNSTSLLGNSNSPSRFNRILKLKQINNSSS